MSIFLFLQKQTNKQFLSFNRNWMSFTQLPALWGIGRCYCLADNDSHANETTAKQESSLSLFGPIFLTFQQSLICWQKCLGPLTAKVTESTTHPADSKHGIWGMAFKQWLSHKPFCHQMLWKAYRADDFLSLGYSDLKGWPPSPPSAQHPPGLSYSCFICLSSPTAAGRVLQVCSPRIAHSRASCYLFVLPALEARATLCSPLAKRRTTPRPVSCRADSLDLIVFGESCAQILA